MPSRTRKSPTAFRTISEVAEELDVAQHVLRFWETKFRQLKPLKRAGGRRFYRPEDIELLKRIKTLLRDERYTIEGVQRLLNTGKLPTTNGSAEAAPAASPAPANDANPAAAADDTETGKEAALAAILAELKALRADLGSR